MSIASGLRKYYLQTKMKILFLTPWYPHVQNPNSGIFVRDQAELASENHEIAVVFAMVDYEQFAISSSSVAESDYKGIKEYRIVVKGSLRLFNQVNYLWLLLRRVRKIADEFKPDLIHVHVSYPMAVIASRLSKSMNIPFIVLEHTRITNHFRSSFHKKRTIDSLKQADVLFAVSKNLAREMSDVTGKEVNVLPNVIDTDRFSITPFQSTIPQIGFLGSVNTPVKGLDILLRAMARIGRDYVLHIGGHGSLLDGYKQLAVTLGIESKCRFYGFFPHADIPSFMSGLSFFVSSSRYETFGIVIIEAMASGLPVVVTRSGGPDDFVDKSDGIMIPTENEEALKTAIEQMMDSYRSYDREVIAVKVRERFSRQAISRQLNKIYSDLTRV